MSDNKNTENPSQSIPEKPKIKHDWYQTESYVTVNVLEKNIDKDKVKVIFQEKSIDINLPSDESFRINLSKSIVPSKCTYRITPTKIELKLKKLNEDTWSDLEEKLIPNEQNRLLTHTRRNWDKFVETELKDDEAQGEAALNELFQKIYSEGSDEVKKAMNKSFMESGGTVLSTNWNEVGEKKVDIKPPDGMEWKKWDEQ